MMMKINMIFLTSNIFSTLSIALFLLASNHVSFSSAAVLTIQNRCKQTIWPGIQPGAGSPILAGGGFQLPSNQQTTINLPAGWSGRIWGRTGCSFDGAGQGHCTTGDCGALNCNGAGGVPPATLAEITLGQGKPDFYDVSLVDGYNLPITMTTVSMNHHREETSANKTVIGEPDLEMISHQNDRLNHQGGSQQNNGGNHKGGGQKGNHKGGSQNQRGRQNGGSQHKGGGHRQGGSNTPTTSQTEECGRAGCVRDLNTICPTDLAVTQGNQVVGCKSACLAFSSPMYCCTGSYSNPQTCKPTNYSQVFKSACPEAYSYAYDDISSLYTCTSASYIISFC